MSTNNSEDFLWHIPTPRTGPGVREQLRNPPEQSFHWDLNSLRRALEETFSERSTRRRAPYILTNETGERLFHQAMELGLERFREDYKSPQVEFEGYEYG